MLQIQSTPPGASTFTNPGPNTTTRTPLPSTSYNLSGRSATPRPRCLRPRCLHPPLQRFQTPSLRRCRYRRPRSLSLRLPKSWSCTLRAAAIAARRGRPIPRPEGQEAAQRRTMSSPSGSHRRSKRYVKNIDPLLGSSKLSLTGGCIVVTTVN